MRHRLTLTVYFLIITVTFLSGFSQFPASHAMMFVLLFSIYILPILYSVSGEVKSFVAPILVVITPFVPIILIIDPIEIGLWGHDPYLFSMNALHEVVAGNLYTAIQTGSYPGTYLFVDCLHRILGLSLETTAKYTPLMTLTIPLFLYLTTKRRLGISNALVIAIIAASTRTLLTFETKFVDEILAVTLAFFLIFFLPIARTQAQQLAGIIAAGVLTLSHHAISFLFVLAISFWVLTPKVLNQLSVLPIVGSFLSPLSPKRENIGITPAFLLILGILGIVLPIFAGQHFIKLLILNLVGALSGKTSTLSGGGVTASPTGFFAVASASQVVSLSILTIFSLWSVYQKPSAKWEIGWLAFVGCLGMIYAVTLTAGRVVPLDPIRLLIFIIPLLGAVSIAQVPIQSNNWHTVGKVLIAILLILPGLASIPAHLLITDIDHKPAIEEGHFTEEQWAASEWDSSFDSHTVAAFERDLWAATQNKYIDDQFATCGDTFVARDGLGKIKKKRNVFYSSGNVRLWRCSQ